MYWLYGLDTSKGNIYIDVLCANEVVSGKLEDDLVKQMCRLVNCAPSINWSKWPVDVVNDTKRHFPEGSSALWLTSCRHFVHTR